MAHGTSHATNPGVDVTAMFASSSSPTSLAEVRDHVALALSQKRPLRIVGAGTWLDANRPVHAEAKLVMCAVTGIVEYEPGDLTLTARAGTTLDEIARATAAHGQWLTLQPHGDVSRATIAATIATASYGPLAHHFGTPRDIVLGVEFVSGVGDVVRGGGRVVKNVAGFDLTRLVTGSWGSLGVITEVTVRLRALPSVQSTLAIDVEGHIEQVEHVRHELNRLPFVPLAAELIDRALARALGVDGRGEVMLVRLGGNEEAMRAQREQLRSVGEAREIDADVWRALGAGEPARAAVVRLSRLPSEFAATWQEAKQIAEQWPEAYCHGDPGRGVVRVVLPLGEPGEAALQSVLAPRGESTRVYERLSAALWSALAPSAIRSRLDRDVKRTFDPQWILNPGILGDLQ